MDTEQWTGMLMVGSGVLTVVLGVWGVLRSPDE